MVDLKRKLFVFVGFCLFFLLDERKSLNYQIPAFYGKQERTAISNQEWWINSTIAFIRALIEFPLKLPFVLISISLWGGKRQFAFFYFLLLNCYKCHDALDRRGHDLGAKVSFLIINVIINFYLILWNRNYIFRG